MVNAQRLLTKLVLHLHHDGIHLRLGGVEACGRLPGAHNLLGEHLAFRRVTSLGCVLDGLLHLLLFSLYICSARGCARTRHVSETLAKSLTQVCVLLICLSTFRCSPRIDCFHFFICSFGSVSPDHANIGRAEAQQQGEAKEMKQAVCAASECISQDGRVHSRNFFDYNMHDLLSRL